MPNYYVLLGLSCDESNWETIEKAIKAKRAEWTKDRNHPKRGRECQQNLELCDDMVAVLKDPQKRTAEQSACREYRSRMKAEAAPKLDEVLDVYSNFVEILQSELDEVVKRFDGIFTEADVRAKVLQRGLSIKPDPGKPAAGPEPMPPSQFKEIAERLKLVQMADLGPLLGAERDANGRDLKSCTESPASLYEFLGLYRNASGAALVAATKKIDGAARKYNVQSAKITAIQELAGHARVLFEDEESRQRYDQSFDEQVFLQLEKLVRQFAPRGEIPAKGLENLKKAAQKLGIEPDEALATIRRVAAKLNLRLDERSTLRQCPCGEYSPESAERCVKCGDPLTVECPNPGCNVKNASVNRSCHNCGFAVGDAKLMRGRIRSAAEALARGDIAQARTILSGVHEFWLQSAEAVELLARLTRAEADALVGQGRHFERQRRFDDGAETYHQALQICPDHPEAKSGLLRCPPEPPTVDALRADTVQMHVTWKPSPSCGSITYRVVRKAGSAPKSATDGDLVCDVTTTSYTDQTTEAGLFYYYALFAVRFSVVSAAAAITGPAVRAADVSKLRATAGDRCVALQWEVPRDAARVEIWRSAGAPPTKPGEGERVKVVTRNSATDTALKNGTTYGYRVIAVFEPRGRSRVFGAGVTCSVRVEEPAQPVRDLAYSLQGSFFHAKWTPPQVGSVQIYLSSDDIAPELGLVLPVQELDRLGSLVMPRGPGVAQGDLIDRRASFLVPVTVSGTTAVVGQAVSVSFVEDVGRVEMKVYRGQLTVSFTWPSDVPEAVIVMRTDKAPTGALDRNATCFRVHRARNELYGCFKHSIEKGVGRLYIAVFSAMRTGNRWAYGPASTQGSRRMIEIAGRRRVKFHIVEKGRFGPWGKAREFELVLTPNAETTLPELVLVASASGRPFAPDDGVRVLSTPAEEWCAPDEPLRIRFPAANSRTTCRVWMFPVSERDAEWLELLPENPKGYRIELPQHPQGNGLSLRDH